MLNKPWKINLESLGVTARWGDERNKAKLHQSRHCVGEAEWQFRNKSPVSLIHCIQRGQENAHLFTDYNESLLKTSLLASVRLLAVKIFFYSCFRECFDEECALNCKNYAFNQQVPVTWQPRSVGDHYSCDEQVIFKTPSRYYPREFTRKHSSNWLQYVKSAKNHPYLSK